jgi:hypothetical protein
MKKQPKETTSTFLNSDGKNTKVTDIVSETDCWYVKKEKRFALTHRAILKIAAAAGISKTYDVEESPNIQPSHKNEMEHIVRVTIKCNAKKKGQRDGCVHDKYENTLTVTGEANKVNAPVLGRGYLRKMAEKRAYDIAVLEHLGLYETTFSEEESDKLAGKKNKTDIEISNVEIEALSEEINLLVLCDTSTKLASTEKLILKNATEKKYSEQQVLFLKSIIDDRKTSIYMANDNKNPF